MVQSDKVARAHVPEHGLYNTPWLHNGIAIRYTFSILYYLVILSYLCKSIFENHEAYSDGNRL